MAPRTGVRIGLPIIIRNSYDKTCAVKFKDPFPVGFKIITGVRQGYIILVTGPLYYLGLLLTLS